MAWPGIPWMLERPISLSGNVTDAVSGDPLAATITPLGITFPAGDTNPSNARFGRYHAFLPAGSYDIEFSAEGYLPQTHMVSISDTTPVLLDIALVPEVQCRGDLNGDISITIVDPITVINAIGQIGGPEDINGDGVVDLLDMLALLPGWGSCLEQSE